MVGCVAGSLDATEGKVTYAGRLFLAVELEDETRHRLAARVDALVAGSYLPGRPVPIPNWHVTLRFLGATSELQRDIVLGALSERLEGEPFPIWFGGLGTFPRARRASVLWIDVADPTGSLGHVATVCEDVAQLAGFAPEERPYRPHLTISRLRPATDIESFVEGREVSTVRMAVDAVTLYRSRTGRDGVFYEVIDRVSW